MSSGLLIFIGIIYLVIGIKLILQGKHGLGVCMLCYGIANFGLSVDL